MYIDYLELKNIRTFGMPNAKHKNIIDFVYRGRHEQRAKYKNNLENIPEPKLANVNLLLGDNGSGKTTILRAIAASAFGPAARDIIRDPSTVRFRTKTGTIRAGFIFHEQDGRSMRNAIVHLRLERVGERLEVIDDVNEDQGLDSAQSRQRRVWKRLYDSANDSFFVVGYGATRRVERLDRYDPGARTSARATRDLRVQSLFEDAFSLIPLASWLPSLKKTNRGRHTQVSNLINELITPGDYRFTGKQAANGDYLFSRGKLEVPFQSMSDGYRALIGWIADLLYHICFGAPKGKKLVDSFGIVLVDEVDLHLHPKWQMQVVKSIASALPNMQFVFTSHSPLVASSLQWMNIITLEVNDKTNISTAQRIEETIYGLDADQVLLTDFFGLRTTRAPGKVSQLEDLQRKARHGDQQAARRIILEMAKGSEAPE